MEWRRENSSSGGVDEVTRPGMSQQRSPLGEGQCATTKRVTLEKVISH